MLFTEDIDRVVRKVPRPVQEQMRTHEHKLSLAGGFVRAVIAGDRPSDIDLFVDNANLAKEVAEALVVEGPGSVVRSQFAHNVRVWGQHVQVIHAWEFPIPVDVLDNFDFTVCQAVIWYDGDEWDGHCGKRFYQDLAAQRLVYGAADRARNPVPLGGTVLRMIKFLRSGYNISPEELSKVLAHFYALEGAVVGPVDDELSSRITARLREVDPRVPLR